MKTEILNAVAAIKEDKIAKGIYPNYATINEICKKTGYDLTYVQMAVIELVASGKVVTGPTINDRYVKII